MLIKTCVHFVQEELSKCFLDMYEWGCYKGTFEEINETLGDLKCTEKITLETMVDILYRIAPADYDNDPELCSARRRLSIVETLNGGEIRRYIADWFNADLRRAVGDAKEKLFELRNAVKAYRRTNKIHDTLIISAFQLRLSDELENIKKFVKKCVEVVNSVEAIPSIILVGFASLNIDVDAQMWVNIALVSPSIRVTTSQGFDFSALGQAKCAKHMNSVAGENGSHGTCGLPGGNLTVVCQQLQDDSHILRSTVSRGQRGGDAQDGGDGVHGTDSIYCKATFEKAIKWEIKYRLLKDDHTAPRELRDGLQLVKYERDNSPLTGAVSGTPGKISLKIKKKSEPGKQRIQAGNGGQGGAGGRGGSILILQANRNFWEGPGSMGQTGRDGKPGKNSHDGYGSPNFMAKVKQWYCRCWWFSDSFAEAKIKIQVEELKVDDQPKLVHAKVAQGNEILAEMNDSLGLGFVKEMYQDVHAQLKETFPQCDFSDLKIGWETATNTLQTA